MSISLCLQVGPSIVIAIAANKQDMSKQQVVSSAESQAYAASINALHFGTSAKTGSGLQDLFQAITDSVIARLPAPGAFVGFSINWHNHQICSLELHGLLRLYLTVQF